MATKAAGFSVPKHEAVEINFATETFDFGGKELSLSYNKATERFDLRLGEDLILSDCSSADPRKRFEELKKKAPPPKAEPPKKQEPA